tara:strand:- start:45 stop:623 length:579 start_codon:yes stop_codon:yes gene_type:complete
MSILYSSLSCLSFSTIPYFIKTPYHTIACLNILTLTSINYHVYEDFKNNYYFIKKTKDKGFYKDKINELIDGLAIILTCNNINFHSLNNYYLYLIQSLSLSSYSFTKYQYDNELIKKIVYLSTAFRALYNYPITCYPLSVSLSGYLYYMKCNEWNIVSRILWHFGNSIYIGMVLYFINNEKIKKLKFLEYIV